MSGIVEINNLINKEEAEKIIRIHCAENNPGNKEIDLVKAKECEHLNALICKLNPYFLQYASSLDIKRNFFYNKIVAIQQQSNSNNSFMYPMHFDEGIDNSEDKVRIAGFVSLLYLNTINENFSGGQLYLPFQKKIIEPILGKMVMFPTGYHYAHKVMPFFGDPRYVLRIFHLYDTELIGEDKKNLLERLTIKQEKKVL